MNVKEKSFRVNLCVEGNHHFHLFGIPVIIELLPFSCALNLENNDQNFYGFLYVCLL